LTPQPSPTDAEKKDLVLLGKAVLNHFKSRADAVRVADPVQGGRRPGVLRKELS
jgi:hypothetical protein